MRMERGCLQNASLANGYTGRVDVSVRAEHLELLDFQRPAARHKDYPQH